MRAHALAVLGGFIGAVAGWLISGAVAVWLAGLWGMSDFEGGRGMFAFLGVGPIGGLLSMILTAWVVLRVAGGRLSLGRSLARLGAVLAVIVLVLAAGIGVRVLTLDTYSATLPPTLEFDLRLPAGMPAPARAAIEVELHTDRNVAPGLLWGDWQPAEDAGQVIAGSVELAFKTSSRLLVVSFPDQPTRLFPLPLSRDPAATAGAGGWRRAEYIDTPGDPQPRPAPADDPVELRYRVTRAGDE